jgi:hypothetical protein
MSILTEDLLDAVFAVVAFAILRAPKEFAVDRRKGIER